MTWIGRKKIAFIPLSRPHAIPPDQIPADWENQILRRILFDPVPGTGVDRSLRAYIHTTSCGRADLDAVVMPRQSVDRQDVIVYASVENIRYVPTSGTNTTPVSRTIAVASGRVTALHAVSNGTYWGDQGADSGSVHLRVAGTTTTLPSPGGIVTSISTKGPAAAGAQAWTVCDSQSCRLQLVFPDSKSTLPIGNDAFGVTVTSHGNVFWGDATGVHRKAF